MLLNYDQLLMTQLGRDPERWKIDSKLVQRRRQLFWEFYHADLWTVGEQSALLICLTYSMHSALLQVDLPHLRPTPSMSSSRSFKTVFLESTERRLLVVGFFL